MARSFTDRVFGGVCGGLAGALRLNVWLVRALFVILSIASLGAFAVLYLLLWWITPQEFPQMERRTLPIIVVVLLMLLTLAAWAARDLGYLNAPNGVNLFYPGVLLVLCAVFFLRQLRA